MTSILYPVAIVTALVLMAMIARPLRRRPHPEQDTAPEEWPWR